MQRKNVNILIDALAFAFFVFLIATGMVLKYVLPPGSGRRFASGEGREAEGKTVSLSWGFSRHEWGDIHFWVAVGIMALLAAHLALHYKWAVTVVKGQTPEGSGARMGLGALGLATLLAVAVSPFLSPKETVQRQREGREVSSPVPAREEKTEDGAEEESIRGSMTLREVQERQGVPAEYLIEKLNLPKDTSPDARLGQLRRQSSFEMEDARALAREYKQREK
ncbi:MAG: DUF4405 domain-containing protein [Nitrospinae bacterium]|nr:DUF4405 domain-containing protein [Nitrospinota bacterium]